MRFFRLAVAASAALFALAPVRQPAQALSCEQGPYFVFFEEGNPSVSSEPLKVLEFAVLAWGNCGSAHVFLAGHTDTNEDPSLAVDRVETIKAYFTARGISASQISIAAFAASAPRIPNAAGTPEPQNRRVEISFGPPIKRLRP